MTKTSVGTTGQSFSEGERLLGVWISRTGLVPAPSQTIEDFLAALEGRVPGIVDRVGGQAAAADILRRIYAYSAMTDERQFVVTGQDSQIVQICRSADVRLRPGEEIGAWCDRVRHARPWLAGLLNEVQLQPEGDAALRRLETRARRAVITVWVNMASVAILGLLLVLPLGTLSSAVALFLFAMELLRLKAVSGDLDDVAESVDLRHRFGLPVLPRRRKA